MGSRRSRISVFSDRTSFRTKRFSPRFKNRNFTSLFSDRTSFRAKGLSRHTQKHNFTLVFRDRTSFRTKGLYFVPGTAPRLKKEIEKKARARGQESKRARYFVKMSRCEDIKI